MTDTDIRVALAEKLGWTHTQIVQGEPVGLSPSRHNIHILPSLYDLCLEGGERLTKEQRERYGRILCDRLYAMDIYELSHRGINGTVIAHFATAPLEVRAKALIEVLP